MATVNEPLSIEAFSLLSESEERHELVRGELRTMTPAGFDHGSVVGNLTSSLGNYIRAQRLGKVLGAETGFRIGPNTVRAPDFAFVTAERRQAVGAFTGYFPGAPDLVVEVVSPNDLYNNVEEKLVDWLDAGVRMAIFVNPQRRGAAVYRSRSEVVILDESHSLDGADVVPGWRMPLSELFAD